MFPHRRQVSAAAGPAVIKGILIQAPNTALLLGDPFELALT